MKHYTYKDPEWQRPLEIGRAAELQTEFVRIAKAQGCDFAYQVVLNQGTSVHEITHANTLWNRFVNGYGWRVR